MSSKIIKALLVTINVSSISISMYKNTSVLIRTRTDRSTIQHLLTLLIITDILASLIGHGSILYQAIAFNGIQHGLTETQALILGVLGITYAALLALLCTACWYTVAKVRQCKPKQRKPISSFVLIVTICCALASVLFFLDSTQWILRFDGFTIVILMCYIVVNIQMHKILNVLKSSSFSEQQTEAETTVALVIRNILKYSIAWIPFLVIMKLAVVARTYESSMAGNIESSLLLVGIWTLSKGAMNAIF